MEENANMEASCEQQSGWYELPVACTSRAEKRLHYTELSLHVNKKSLPLLEEIRIPENFLILLHSGMYEWNPGDCRWPPCRPAGGAVSYTPAWRLLAGAGSALCEAGERIFSRNPGSERFL